MEPEVIHISQGGLLHLANDDKDFLLKAFASMGISTDCINLEQDIVSFPQSYVGYLNLPTKKIIIDPKHDGLDLRHVIRIYYFLYAAESLDLDDPIYNIDKGGTYDIIDLFVSELDSVVKKGLPVEYKEGRDNLQFLRGTPNVVQTLINKRLAKREVFDCSYDELSKDIAINQVLYKAYNKVSRMMDIGRAGLLKKDFAEVSEVYRIPEVELNTNTLYCKKALSLAYMILNDLAVSDYGNQAYGQNLLINFDKLFEDFVKKILVSYSGDYNFSYWDTEKQYAVCSSSHYGDYSKSYIPDMLYLYQNREIPESAFGILDMKNKTSKPFSNADVYQMFFYANQLHSKRVILCYPACENRENALLKFDQEDFSLRKIYGVYINIAGDTSKEFKDNIYRFIDAVKGLM